MISRNLSHLLHFPPQTFSAQSFSSRYVFWWLLLITLPSLLICTFPVFLPVTSPPASFLCSLHPLCLPLWRVCAEGWMVFVRCVCVLSWLRLSVWSFISKKHHNMTAVCEIEVTQNRNVWWNGFYPHFFQAGVKLVKDGLPSDQHLGKLWHKMSVLWFILILIGICVVPSNVFPCYFFADHTCFGNKSPIGWLFFFACDI